jgi:hypothetical protein
MIRVCHSFFGADHGYPYLYQEHPDEAILPMADLARGSSAGGVTYRNALFGASHRGPVRSGKATDLLKRVDKDVLPKKPAIVVIQIGVNDASAGVTPEQFRAQLIELIDSFSRPERP